MKRLIRPGNATVTIVAVAGMLFSTPGYAYLDPGTGSIILQGLLAGLAVAIGVVRGYWQQVKSYLAAWKSKSEVNSNADREDLEHTSDIRTKP